MKFKGKPGMHVVDPKTSVCIGVFDDKGYLEITDKVMIEKMKRKFKTVVPRKKTAATPKSKDVK